MKTIHNNAFDCLRYLCEFRGYADVYIFGESCGELEEVMSSNELSQDILKGYEDENELSVSFYDGMHKFPIAPISLFKNDNGEWDVRGYEIEDSQETQFMVHFLKRLITCPDFNLYR